MMGRLEDLAREFAELRAESATLRARLAEVRQRITELRPAIGQAIVDEVRAGCRQPDISQITGYSRERVRQICRAAGVEPVD